MVTQQLGQKAHIGLGGRNFTAFGSGVHHSFEGVDARHCEAFICLGTAMWQVATKRFTTLVQVAHFGGVIRRLVERNLGQFAVWNRQIKTIAEDFDVFVRQLLSLVNGVFTFS